MLSKNLEDLYFSQSALVAYQNCPLKFRRRYLDGLFWPTDWGGDEEQKAAVELGRVFHLLAERYYERGELPDPEPEPMELAQWFQRLIEFRPYHEDGIFLPEHEIRLNQQGMKLIAKYDLLYITSDGRGIIYDWKTNATQPKIDYWRHHLQTRIYQYVLCRAGGAYSPTGSWDPEKVTMIYFNPRYPKEIQPISYSQEHLLRDETFLKRLIQEIKSLDYDQFLATGDQKRCKYCEYRPICHGKRALALELEEEDMDFDLSWDEIDQIQL